MERYLNKLVEQFKQSTGAKNVDVNSQTFISEFSSWIKSRQAIGEDYLGLLDYMELHRIGEAETAEIGKGKYDTLVSEANTTIITPYSKGIIAEPERIITADFSVYDSTPILVRTTEKNTTQLDPITSSETLTFMTQNPYTVAQIANWEQLHNSGENNIVVGVYGSIYDKDTDRKIKELESLREKLYDSYIEEQCVLGDTYCYAIASKRKYKVKTKTRTR